MIQNDVQFEHDELPATERRFLGTQLVAPWHNRKRSRNIAPSRLVLLATLAIFTAWPLIAIHLPLFDDGPGSAIERALSIHRIGQTTWNTFYLAGASVGLALLIGGALALATLMVPPKIKPLITIAAVAPMMIPAVANVIGWVIMLTPTNGYGNVLLRSIFPFLNGSSGPFNVYSVLWIVIITATNQAAFVFLFLNTRLNDIPTSLYDAAAISGSTFPQILRRIVWPQLRPGVVYAIGISLLLTLGQFTGPLLLGRSERINVLAIEMWQLTQSFPIDYGAGAVLAWPILITAALILLLQRAALRHPERYDFGVRSPSRGWSFPGVSLRDQVLRGGALVMFLLYGTFATLMPIAGLVLVSLEPFWSGSIDPSTWSLAAYTSGVWNNTTIRTGIVNSVITSVAASCIALVLGYACALYITARRRAGRAFVRSLEMFLLLPIVVPPALYGLGILFSYSGPPFRLYGTTAILVIAYVALLVVHASRLISSSMLGVSESFDHAGRLFGASELRVHVSILLPVLRQALVGTFVLGAVILFHEFSASMLIRSTNTHVIGTALYELWLFANYPVVAAASVVVVLVTLCGVVAALVIGRDWRFGL